MIPLLWLRRVPGIVWAVVVACAMLGAAGTAVYRRGVVHEQTATLRAKIQHDVQIMHWHDTVVVHDSIHFVKWVTRYDTLRQTVQIQDTVWVKHFIAVADSTIGACKQQVLSLYSDCAAKDTVIASQRALLAIHLPVSHPVTVVTQAKAAVIGAAVDEIVRAVLRARH